ncbi:uncharacterized protein LOC142333477 [Lycorma delicatula]|uniref:uncharacterized protein LOC142333477 n=1 Tax=Lycorma delicatula TaxID=130591 RepID=UPI003F50F6B9
MKNTNNDFLINNDEKINPKNSTIHITNIINTSSQTDNSLLCNNANALLDSNNKDLDCMLGSIYEFNNDANQCESDCMYDEYDDSDFIIDSDCEDDDYLIDEKYLNKIMNSVSDNVDLPLINIDVPDGNENFVKSVEQYLHYADPVADTRANFKSSSSSTNVKNNNINLLVDNNNSADNTYINVASNITSNSFPISKTEVKSLITEIDMDSDLLLSEDIYETIYYHNKNINKSLSNCDDMELNIDDDYSNNTFSHIDDSCTTEVEEKSSTYIELINNAIESDTISVSDSIVCDNLEHDCSSNIISDEKFNSSGVYTNYVDDESAININEKGNENFETSNRDDTSVNLNYREIETPCVKNIVTVEKICFREQKRRSSLETNDDVLGGKSYSDSVLNRTKPSKGFKLFWWRKDSGTRSKDKITRSTKSVTESRPMKNIHNNSNTSSKESLSCYGSTDMAVFNNDLDNCHLSRTTRRYEKSKKHSLNPCCVG